MKERIGGLIERVRSLPPVAELIAVTDVYGRAAGGLLASGLAFAALFAAVPTVLLVLGLTGLLLDDPAFQVRIVDGLTELFPPLEPLFADLLATVTSRAAATSILGLIGLVWAVSQFYVTLDTAFARIFVREPERDPFRRTVRGFLWVAVILGLVLALVATTATLRVLGTLLPAEYGGATGLSDAFAFPPVAFGLATSVVAIAFRVLPPRAPAWRAVLPPAILVAAAVTLLTFAFARLAPLLVGAAAVAGSLAAAFIALAWLSFSFQALLVGASWVAVREGRPRPPRPHRPGT